MKFNNAFRNKSAFTLVELMIVMVIISVLFSIGSPRFDLLLQKAVQSSTKNNLGSIRSTIALYYSDNEGRSPFSQHPNGFPQTGGLSLSALLAPKYIGVIPTPKLLDRAGNFNGTGLQYDDQAINSMERVTPVNDIVIFSGAPGPMPGINMPFVYDALEGWVYICNDNFDTTGKNFYEW